MQLDPSSSGSWLGSLGSKRERTGKERKGWSITVHDLSRPSVALASMVTPFVVSTDSDRLSRSNSGAWLMFCPGDCTWKPWGRLEAWRERDDRSDDPGYGFELLPNTNINSVDVLLAESMLSTSKGGKFTIDLTEGEMVTRESTTGKPKKIHYYDGGISYERNLLELMNCGYRTIMPLHGMCVDKDHRLCLVIATRASYCCTTIVSTGASLRHLRNLKPTTVAAVTPTTRRHH